MKQLRIYFTQADLSEFRWCLIDADQSEVGVCDAEALPALLKQSNQTIFVIPQHWIVQTELETSDNNEKSFLASVAYQLEDQFAEDVEDLHFAQGKAQTNEDKTKLFPFVAIKSELMQQLIAFEKQYQIQATYYIIESEFTVEQGAQSILAQQHEKHWIIKTNKPSEVLVCYDTDIDEFIDLVTIQNQGFDVIRVEQSEVDLLRNDIDINRCINLKQKLFSPLNFFQSYIKPVLIPMSLVIISGLLVLLNQYQQNQQLEISYNQIVAQQQHYLGQFNAKLKTAKNPKKSLIKALQKQTPSNQEQGFISSFERFSIAKRKFKSISVKKAHYKNQQLIVDLETPNLQHIDQLNSLLTSKGFNVSIDQMNTSVGLTKARLKMELRS